MLWRRMKVTSMRIITVSISIFNLLFYELLRISSPTCLPATEKIFMSYLDHRQQTRSLPLLFSFPFRHHCSPSSPSTRVQPPPALLPSPRQSPADITPQPLISLYL